MEPKSTETASQSFIQNAQKALDKHLHIVGIFLDISKAYDVINHNRLLDKLDSYGIRGSVSKWFQSYLTSRKQFKNEKMKKEQFVEISQVNGGKHIQHRFQSSSKTISCGLPQGSLLGPLLFLIYINEISLNIQGAKLILYADDTNVLVMDKNKEALQIKLSSVMKQLENWFLKNDLIINTTKTAAMSFHLCRSKLPFKPHILLQNIEIN
jgi:hypothetical protein